MRGGKDEEKVVSPMFPRVHVNDTERGGPRGPPRNKMALYQHLTVPSHHRMLPLPSTTAASTLAPSTLGVTPFCNTRAPSNPPEKLRFHSSTKPTDYHKSVNVMRQLQSAAKGHLFQPPNFRNLSLNKHGGDDAVTVPTFSRAGTQQREDREQHFTLFRTTSAVHMKGNDIVEPSSRQHLKNQIGDNGPKLCQTRHDPLDSSISIPSTGDNILVDSTKDRDPGSLKRAHESSDQNHRSLLEAVNKRRGTDGREAVSLRDKAPLLEDALKGMTSEKCSRPATGGNDGDDKEYESVGVGEADKNNDTLDSSMVDSVSVLDITPDDVVGVIGEKQFWKARTAILNQQRVFAVQVFELHRLIKVQRLIAESPHLLLEDTLSAGKHSSKGSLTKKLSESVIAPSPTITGSQNPNDETDQCGAESALPKLLLPLPLHLPLPHVSEETRKGLASHRPIYESSLPPNAKPSPWCFPSPPGNQWLIPVMSPSEGFVYKPYAGPGPPNAGLMAPIYGSYDPRFGILPGTSPLGQPYFPPYGMPVMNPSASERQDDQVSNVDIDLGMSSEMSRVVPWRARKQSEWQGSSTASSPSTRVNGEALPLFPLASDLNTGEPSGKVIKVVPHNPRLATESAARIFQFIQEERKQLD